jgi:hypothetical protein
MNFVSFANGKLKKKFSISNLTASQNWRKNNLPAHCLVKHFLFPYLPPGSAVEKVRSKCKNNFGALTFKKITVDSLKIEFSLLSLFERGR